MPFFCTECGLKCEDDHKFCARCGTNLSEAKQSISMGNRGGSEKMPAKRASAASWNLSGEVPFSLTARISTSKERGTIAAKCFSDGLWKNGGSAGQGKMLFLRNGVVCFDIGWVGCVTGRTHVSDGKVHLVGVKFEDGRYKVLVDGRVDGEGLHAVPDNSETAINIGTRIGHHVASDDMAPDFSGDLTNVEYRGPAEIEDEEVSVASEANRGEDCEPDLDARLSFRSNPLDWLEVGGTSRGKESAGRKLTQHCQRRAFGTLAG